MNRNLLLFALFLVVLGLGFGIYLVSLFGLLMLIPALMAPSKRAPVPVSAPPKRETKRIIPLQQPQPLAVPPKAESQTPSMSAPPQPPTDYRSFSPAVFPNSMFSYLSPPSNPPTVSAGAPAKEPDRDELIETGAMLAILRLFLG